MRRLLLILGLVLCTCKMVASQYSNFYFRNIGVDMGLSHNMVYAILQDKQGFMWFGTQEGLNRFDGVSFKVYKKDLLKKNSLKNDAIFALTEDRDGVIWIGTDNGVALYDPKYDRFSDLELKTSDGETCTGVVRSIVCDDNGNVWLALGEKGIFKVNQEREVSFYSLMEYFDDGHGSIRDVVFDMDDNLWIATYQQGLLKLDKLTGKITQIKLTDRLKEALDNNINRLCLLDSETLLIGTGYGLLMYDLRYENFSILVSKNRMGKKMFVRDIHIDKEKRIWLGTETGGYVYSVQGDCIANFKHRQNDTYSLSDNAVHSIYQDREGGIWLGTFFGGVNYYTKAHAQFEKYYPIMEPNSIMGKSISEFCEDGEGKIWVGTEDKGLYHFDPEKRTFSKGKVAADNVHALLYDENRLWVGSFSEGLFVVDLKSGKVKNYLNSPLGSSLSDNNVYSIYKDYKGTVWVGTMTGLHRYQPKTDTFIRVGERMITSQVNDILEDFDGTLWFATLGQGLFSYDYNTDRWNHIPIVVEGDSVRGRKIICLLEDKSHKMWLGTEGAGLVCFDKKARSMVVKNYTVSNGLPNNVIYRLVEDAEGGIWGSTNYGLFCLDPSDETIRKYTHSDGLLGNQFNYKSGMITKSGKIYFGGIKGFVAFRPDEMNFPSVQPKVVFNSFQLNNNEISVGEEDALLTKAITYTDKIELSPEQSTFSLGFAVLDYDFPKDALCAYKLEGWDSDWISVKQLRRITYSNIPFGDYVLRVKVSDKDGVWSENEASMSIRILPPAYLTVWAFVIYAVLIAVICVYVYRRQAEHVKKKNEKVLDLLQREKNKELYDAKITFFTNITHEIRTPLSLIKMPLEEVMRKIKKTDGCYENLEIIQKNTDRLLKLVNELLDFRRVEAKDIQVSFMTVDLVEMIRETVKRFIPTANIQDIQMIEELPEDGLRADVDVEIFTKILSNLLNNALKHSATFIKVSLVIENDMACLCVVNDGERIPKEQAERIFEPFVKLDENSLGAGIGLAFVRSLVESHNGKIYVDIDQPKVTFVLKLPITQPLAVSVDENKESKCEDVNEVVPEIIPLPKEDMRKVILLVEDNEEFQQFMAGQLKQDYRLLKAANGKDALDVLNTHRVDLVISDIMMPVMDGMALCKEIKEDIRYSHIPVILLSAKMDLHVRLDGMKLGADEYIVKPYSVDYLKVRIENLMSNRNKIKEAYQHSPESSVEDIAYSKADEEFLNKLVEKIHQHLNEDDLNVDSLAQMLNMSRATLYRKLKNVSELTPNEFIRLVRLKKAAELLKQREYRVNEIAFIVGFNSVSYFAKCFSKQFGVLPKDYGNIQAKGTDTTK